MICPWWSCADCLESPPCPMSALMLLLGAPFWGSQNTQNMSNCVIHHGLMVLLVCKMMLTLGMLTPDFFWLWNWTSTLALLWNRIFHLCYGCTVFTLCKIAADATFCRTLKNHRISHRECTNIVFVINDTWNIGSPDILSLAWRCHGHSLVFQGGQVAMEKRVAVPCFHSNPHRSVPSADQLANLAG